MQAHSVWPQMTENQGAFVCRIKDYINIGTQIGIDVDLVMLIDKEACRSWQLLCAAKYERSVDILCRRI
jgi:hypothetical protein